MADGSGYILLRNGAEFSTAESLLDAAMRAADDAISGYPEATLDIMQDVLGGRVLGDVIGTQSYREALADEIVARWNLSPDATAISMKVTPSTDSF